MRGSLNMIVRKNEQKNIIQGNKVSKKPNNPSFLNFLFFVQKILQKLKDVKPGIGSIAEWKRHESRSNYLKQNIGGSFLMNKKHGKMRQTGELGLSNLDQSLQEGPHMLNVKLPKLSSSTENVDL